MKTVIATVIALLAAALLSGCTITTISKKADGSGSAMRASLGTNPAVGSLDIHDGQGAGVKLEQYSHEQQETMKRLLSVLLAPK